MKRTAISTLSLAAANLAGISATKITGKPASLKKMKKFGKSGAVAFITTSGATISSKKMKKLSSGSMDDSVIGVVTSNKSGSLTTHYSKKNFFIYPIVKCSCIEKNW